MAVYLIVEAKKIINKEKYDEYIKKVPATIKKFDAKYLVRGGKVTVMSGDWDPSRIIIVEFESMEKFRSWWNSSEYQAVACLREEGAHVNAVVIEGFCNA